MQRTSVRLLGLAAALGAAAIVGACSQTQLRDAPDFGESVRQDQAAQIANPDAHYAGAPGPASNGKRADSAVDRYMRGKVTAPQATATSDVGGGGGGGGGGASQ
jgi:type IV pilus biogenesis protein CpaD/CtpE